MFIEFKLWLALPSNYLSKTEASREKHKSLSNHFLSRKVAGKITLQDRTKVFWWIIPGISGIIQWKFFKFRYLLYIIRNFLCKFLLSSIEDMYEIAIYENMKNRILTVFYQLSICINLIKIEACYTSIQNVPWRPNIRITGIYNACLLLSLPSHTLILSRTIQD